MNTFIPFTEPDELPGPNQIQYGTVSVSKAAKMMSPEQAKIVSEMKATRPILPDRPPPLPPINPNGPLLDPKTGEIIGYAGQPLPPNGNP
jgi:hypothetical protein